MDTIYRALCSGFFINQKLTTKMDLPLKRETVLDLFERVRKDRPRLERFKRYQGELALESPIRAGEQEWVALRRNSVRSGVVDPPSVADGLRLHRLALELAPFYLSINPLDIAGLELTYGFDLDASGNHNAIVRDALLRDTPLAKSIDSDAWAPLDIQPYIGIALNERCDLQAWIEVKTKTSVREVRQDRYRDEPISVCLTVRKVGSLKEIKELPLVFDTLTANAERLVNDRVVPHLIQPLRQAIASANR
ncbi:MAG: hypothetical protein IBJ10_01705 [Phycisphaerales bacterium]|nr:hypothetical protein [Phycisphaerales bacterium]